MPAKYIQFPDALRNTPGTGQAPKPRPSTDSVGMPEPTRCVGQYSIVKEREPTANRYASRAWSR